MRPYVAALAVAAVVNVRCSSLQDEVSLRDRIVFSSFRPAGWDIYYFAESGGAPSRLTDHPSLDYDPVFSPDGRWAVFTSERLGSPDLFALDLHNRSSPPRLLIESAAMEDQAAFSPDGSSLAFVSTVTGNADIFVISFRPDRSQRMSDARNVTQSPGGDFRPAFSPDGVRLAFSSDRDTAPVAHPVFPFSRQREGEIYVLDLEDEAARRLTELPGWDGSPVWTPDGTSVLFYSAGGQPRPPQQGAATQEGGFRIWSLDVASGERRAVSPENMEALSPRLTPDGRVAFATRSGQGYSAEWRIVSVSSSEGVQVRAESDQSNDYWGPDFHAETGAMLCFGTGPVEAPYLSEVGLAGPLLAPGFPSVTELSGRTVELYPMRHAFSVPPHPSRNLVVIQHEVEGVGQLLLAAMDGSESRELVRLDGEGQSPMSMKWSKTGDWITYTVGPFLGSAGAASDVWKVRLDGTGTVNLTEDSPANDGFSDFSASDARVVFRSSRDSRFDLYLMDADGGGAMKLTDDDAKDNFPVFSPTDELIAFVSDNDGVPDAKGHLDFDIYTLALSSDGQPLEVQRITDSPGQDAHVTFSPDGEWLIFTSERGGINDEEPLVQELLFGPQMYGEIYAYRLADGETVRLTHNKWEDGAPFWVGPAR